MASGMEGYPPVKRERFVDLYMDVAKRVSEMSYANRLKVGAIAVKDGSIISMGWNGMPTGWENSCEEEIDGELKTKQQVMHAEENLLLKMAKSHFSADGASLFITHSPCLACSKLIFGSGIREVHYGEDYRSDDGIQFLRRCGVKVEKVA